MGTGRRLTPIPELAAVLCDSRSRPNLPVHPRKGNGASPGEGMDSGTPRAYRFSGFRVDLVRRQVVGPDGSQIALPSRAYDVLVHLIANRDRLITKDDLMKAVWPHVIVEDNNVNQAISTLRRGLADQRDSPRFIATIAGRGYRFVADVEEDTKSPGGADSGKGGIAVLAFDNMSGDPEQEYFSDGISEDIITELSKLSALHVIARNSSFVYKKTAVPIPELARALNVRYVLEGSVRKSGNRVRVTAQLIDARTSGHVWVSRFDRDLTDIFAVQDEITREIVGALELTLTAADQRRLARSRAANVEAYEFFLRARDALVLCTDAGNIAARELAGAAIAIDPGYAAAHAVVAFSHLNDYANGFGNDPAGSLQSGLALAQRAVETDPEDPFARFVLAFAYQWTRQLDKADVEIERGLALAPSSADLLIAKAANQLHCGDATSALATLDAALRVDPHYPEIYLQYVADAHFSLGDYAQAIAAIEQRLARNPQSATAYALLASCYGHLERPEDGRRAWEQVLRISPGFSMERRRDVLPFRNPEEFDRRVEGLRKAGLTV
jgi:adenylate cyclase